MRLFLAALFILSPLFASSPVGEEMIYSLNIKNEKKAKEIFSFLKNYDFKKSFFEDWSTIDKKSFSRRLYFDTQDLKLYRNKSEAVLIKKREGKRKKELILFDNAVYKVKRYKKQISLYDKHPLFGVLNRGEREEFLNKLKSFGIDNPLKLKNLFNLTKINWEIIIEKDNTPYAIIVLQRDLLDGFTFAPEFYRLIFKIKLKKYISVAERLYLEKFLDNLRREIERKFSLKGEVYKDEYHADFVYLKNSVPFFVFAIKHPTLYYFLFALSIGIIGLAIFFVLFKFFDRKTTESQ